MKKMRAHSTVVAVVLAVLTLGMPSASATSPQVPSISAHAIAAPGGFFMAHLFLLDQDGGFAGLAALVVTGTGVSAGTSGPHAGSWYELILVLAENWQSGVRYYTGELPPDDVTMGPDVPGLIRMPLGDLGQATLHLTPEPGWYKATLVTVSGTYVTGSTGLYQKYDLVAEVARWQYSHVLGTVGALTVSDHFNDIELEPFVATAAAGASVFTETRPGGEGWPVAAMGADVCRTRPVTRLVIGRSFSHSDHAVTRDGFSLDAPTTLWSSGKRRSSCA